MLPSRYSSRQPTQDRFPSQTSVFSSARSSGPPQTLSAERYFSRATNRHDTHDTAGYDSELGYLLSPPSPPPSLDQILSVGPNNSSSQRPVSTPSLSNHNRGIYENMERDLFAEPSSSSQRYNTDAISTLRSNSRYQDIYDGFARALSASATPTSSSRQQSTADESTSRSSREPNVLHHPGVRMKKNKWVVEWRDPSQGNRKIWIGSFNTQREGIDALEAYKTSRGMPSLPNSISPHPGVFKHGNGWCARYGKRGEQVYLGTFSTIEAAQRVLREHREARGLPPTKPKTRRRMRGET